MFKRQKKKPVQQPASEKDLISLCIDHNYQLVWIYDVAKESHRFETKKENRSSLYGGFYSERAEAAAAMYSLLQEHLLSTGAYEREERLV
jgi:hypothetical protein